MSLSAMTAIGSAALTGLLSSLGPFVLGRLPEPSNKHDGERVTGECRPVSAASERAAWLVIGQPEPYRRIASAPRLGWWLAAVGAVAGGFLGSALGPVGALAAWCYLGAVGVVLSYVDARTLLLPTRIISTSYLVVAFLLVLAAVQDGTASSVLRAGLGWAAVGGLYFVLWLVHPAGIGYGDVRLAGLLGLALGYLGWSELITGVYAGLLLGGIGGAALWLLRKVPDKRYAYGPFMVTGALIGACAGPLVAGGHFFW